MLIVPLYLLSCQTVSSVVATATNYKNSVYSWRAMIYNDRQVIRALMSWRKMATKKPILRKGIKERASFSLINFVHSLRTPERFFLIFSILFGFLFVFLTPPLQVPDEQAHFIRAYQVSDLDFVSPSFKLKGQTRYGSQLPTSLTTADGVFLGNVAGHAENDFPKSIFKQYIKQPLNPDKTQRTIVEAAAVYSPVVYVPQAAGISIGKIFEASPLIMIWLGRLMNLALWVSVMYFALKLWPVAKWAIVILALNPVAVFLSASLSPDVTNISFAFLFVSLVVNTFTSSSQGLLSKKYLGVILGALVVLALSKPVDLVFGLLLFAIPWRRFGTKLRYWSYCATALLLSGGLFALWNYQIKDILVTAVKYQYAGNISDSAQLSYILHAPLSYLHILIDNFVLVIPGSAGDAVLGTFFGVFGWLDTSIPLWTVLTYILLLFLALLYQFGRGAVVTVKQKLLFLTVFALGFIGNITAMYFNSTTVGNNLISGVQGRYFIAFSVLLLVLFTARKKILELSNDTMSLLLSSGMVVVLGMTALKLFLRYYH